MVQKSQAGHSAKRVHTNSGANVFLGEADGAGPAVEEALRTLKAMEDALGQLRAAGAELEVDVGVVLSESDWTRSVALGAEELEFLARFGIRLVVSAYRGGEGG